MDNQPRTAAAVEMKHRLAKLQAHVVAVYAATVHFSEMHIPYLSLLNVQGTSLLLGNVQLAVTCLSAKWCEPFLCQCKRGLKASHQLNT